GEGPADLERLGSGPYSVPIAPQHDAVREERCDVGRRVPCGPKTAFGPSAQPRNQCQWIGSDPSVLVQKCAVVQYAPTDSRVVLGRKDKHAVTAKCREPHEVKTGHPGGPHLAPLSGQVAAKNPELRDVGWNLSVFVSDR